MDREKIIGHLNDCMEASRRDNAWVFVRKDIVEDAIAMLNEQDDLGTELTNAVELIHKKNERIEILLKEKGIVVRCKDCKHGEKSPTFKYYPDVTWCNEYSTSHNDDWFCADGERKSE